MCTLYTQIDRMTIIEVGKALKEFTIPEDHELVLFETIEKKFTRKEIKDMIIELGDKDDIMKIVTSIYRGP